MQQFRSLSEVNQATLPQNPRHAVTQAMRTLLEAYGPNYDPDDHGYVILVDQNTTDRHALELFGKTWMEAGLEGGAFDPETNCFSTCVLLNNEFGYTIIIPDEPWLDPQFRGKLMAELMPNGCN